MKCAKLNLMQRSSTKTKLSDDKPKRYCQKRLVNPEQEDHPRWFDVLDRFCDNENRVTIEPHQDGRSTPDLCLSVQNLQFQGKLKIQQRKRPRTSFKYKNSLDGQKHRMFVKEIVDDNEQFDLGRMSELTTYADDYTKYFLNSQSRSSSRESMTPSINKKENKSVQVNMKQDKNIKKELKLKKNQIDKNNENEIKPQDNDTRVAFHKYGSRKSLTITRAESPATLQVIRVDVVCNYSTSSTMSDYEENKKQYSFNDAEKRNEVRQAKNSRFANKYFLTNTVKTLDEKLSGGKVTLLCKTYRLTDRCGRLEKEKITKETNTKRCKVQK